MNIWGLELMILESVPKENRIGRATGLAWTEVGGDILTIESSHPGKGALFAVDNLAM